MDVEVRTPDFAWMAEQVANPRSFLQAYRRYRRGQIKRTMDAGRDPYGTPYRRLNARYARYKRATYGEQPILTATGTMRASYQTKLQGGAIIETMQSPADDHQAGNPPVPQRLIFPVAARGLPDEDRIAVGKLARRYLRRTAKKAPDRVFMIRGRGVGL